MKCLALDDEPLALELLIAYLKRMPHISPQGFYNNPDEARVRLEQHDIDLLLLDIQMPDQSGLQFLKQLERKPMVVFTTAYAEYALEGFNLDAVDYLLKPFDFQRFEKAMNKAVDYKRFLDAQKTNPELLASPQTVKSLFVKVGYNITQIALEDIKFIEAFDDYVKIHADGKPVLTLLSIKNILEMLPADRFLRIHRSFVVALDKIENYKAQKVNIAGRSIPVGDTFKGKLKSAFSNPPLFGT